MTATTTMDKTGDGGQYEDLDAGSPGHDPLTLLNMPVARPEEAVRLSHLSLAVTVCPLRLVRASNMDA